MKLIERTRELIGEMLGTVSKPVVLCSFGKDSMVLLALLREQWPDIPVVYLPVYDHPTKHQFAEQVIHDWKLNLVVLSEPHERDLIGKGHHVEILEQFRIGGLNLTLPIEAEPGYSPDANCNCAVERLTAPLATEPHDFDGVLIGHRGDDIDPTQGAIPLQADRVVTDGGTVFYPLKDWTEQDIWKASLALGIPQNGKRYFEHDMAHNADYFPLCTRCYQPGQPGETVPCPKGGEVLNLGRYLNLDERRELWRSQFVNIQPLTDKEKTNA